MQVNHFLNAIFLKSTVINFITTEGDCERKCGLLAVQSLAKTSSDLEMRSTSKGRDDIKRSRLTGISITRRSGAHAGHQIINWESLLLKNIGKRPIKNVCHQFGMNSRQP